MTRAEALAAVIAAADTISTAPVASWGGEARAFNEEAVFPSVWVSHEGMDFGPWLTLGTSTASYERTHRISVFVSAESQADAFDELEALETNLPGAIGANRRIELSGPEDLESSELGHVLYRQRYTIRDP